ncbi:hypothetical protein KCU78_g4968, partial [Aureobasidium melanogenum]
MQEKIVEDITSNIMGILDSRLKTLVDETAPQIRVAVRQALGDRDRAPSQPSSNPVGYTPPAVGNDMPQASLVPKKTLARKSASKAKSIAVAVVCSLKPRPSARHPQLAGTLTKQDRTPRRFDSSTTATSPSEIRSQSSRSVSIVKIEESSNEGCFHENNSDGDDDFDMKESSDFDDERSASDDGGSPSDSDYIDVADHVDNAVNERSARSTRTAKTSAGASRLGIAGGYETPTEENFVEINQVYSLAEWIAAHAAEAPRLLGKKNTRLKLAKVRIQIWPADVRHTNFQLRAIWKYCNERCWQLAPYAFNTDLRPYAEFAWVVYSTKIRFSSNETTLTIAERPALAAPLVNTVKHTNSTDNRRSAATALETLSRPSVNKAEPPPNASRTPKSRTNGNLPQAAHTPGPHSATAKEMSRTLGKATVRSAEALFGSPSQPPSMRPPRPADSRMSKTTPASGLKSGHAPELAQPPPKTLLNKTGTLNAAVKSQSSAQALHHRDRTQPFEARTHHEPTSQTNPSRIKKETQIHPSLSQDSGYSSRNEPEARIPYSPTPGLSSSSTHPRIEPVSDVRPPYRDGAKSPGPPNGKKQKGSVELGTAASTRSAEMFNNETEPCKHRQKGQECEKCGYECGNCHRPGRICSKQRAEARAGKRKADDPDVKVEPSASDTQLTSVPKKKKPRIRDSVDPVVKVEEPAMQLSQLPKKKKLRTRDSVGSWYDPIEMD